MLQVKHNNVQVKAVAEQVSAIQRLATQIEAESRNLSNRVIDLTQAHEAQYDPQACTLLCKEQKVHY